MSLSVDGMWALGALALCGVASAVMLYNYDKKSNATSGNDPFDTPKLRELRKDIDKRMISLGIIKAPSEKNQG